MVVKQRGNARYPLQNPGVRIPKPPIPLRFHGSENSPFGKGAFLFKRGRASLGPRWPFFVGHTVLDRKNLGVRLFRFLFNNM